MNISSRIANELGIKSSQVDATIALLDEGSTVPFIARYRKEVTAGLDDTQLRNLEERLIYLRELNDRRESIIKVIAEQGKLTDALKQTLEAAETKTRLEDLYAPYKTKRRTKAQIAREAGIEPLLDAIIDDPEQSPESRAKAYINVDAGFADEAAVLDGAKQIFMERVVEVADLIGELRDLVWDDALMVANVVADKEAEAAKFKDYFDYQEALKLIPSHRALALFRGRSEGLLRVKLMVPGQDDVEGFSTMGVCDRRIAHHFGFADQGRAADAWLMECVRWSWRIKVSMKIDTELLMRLREAAESEAIRVFGDNMRDLLLAAPAGEYVTMGLDPGIRTGVKVVVVDATGKLLDYATIYPFQPKNQWDASVHVLATLAKKHGVGLISIGNGTASRETDKLVKDLFKQHADIKAHSIVVSEAGASVYSASELAAKEFPDLDVSIRGAVSIARRLQDPLAELVKIEPKAIGVGQYQHDVNQHKLSKKLDAVIEDCVNAVGVDINTASAPLLMRVAGLSTTLAHNIVEYREREGVFSNRKQVLKVARLGGKAFEQSAGFLRIQNGTNPLDASSVHPEAYPVVERILAKNSCQIHDIIGNKKLLADLSVADYVNEKAGEVTVNDIIKELQKPGRDPRPEFKTATFKEGVETIKDLRPDMILEGVISNVTNFGAFVDLGVHQDGLVHISALADRFVKDPRDVVKTGDIVKVKVQEVDVARQRIGLTMRLTDETPSSAENQGDVTHLDTKRGRGKGGAKAGAKVSSRRGQKKEAPVSTSMADAFSRLKR